MAAETARIIERLNGGELRALFLEDLGWDRAGVSFPVKLTDPGQRGMGPRDRAAPFVAPAGEIKTVSYGLTALAEKRGMHIFRCETPGGGLPNAPDRYRIQHQVAKYSRENIVVFVSPSNRGHVWQWVRRGHNKGVQVFEHIVRPAEDATYFAERLLRIRVSLVEEETGDITLAEMVRRAAEAFYSYRPPKFRPGTPRARLSNFDISQLEPALQEWLSYVYAVPRLGRWDERETAEAYLSGDTRARARFIDANLYLVPEIAWKMTQDDSDKRRLLADLIQEAYSGLLEAVENYDPSLGYRFQTYAALRIHRNIQRAIHASARAIYLPVYLREWIDYTRRRREIAEDLLWQQLGRPPAEEELAEFLGLPAKERARIGLTDDPVCSFDSPERVAIVLRTADPEGVRCPYKAAERRSVERAIAGLLSTLKARENLVLTRRFGLDGRGAQTLQALAEELNVTRERVRQIEKRALLRLHAAMVHTDMVETLTGNPNTPAAGLTKVKPPIPERAQF